MRLIHTADLQIGARFSPFPESLEGNRQSATAMRSKSTDVQILVLTCHSSMYRGVGHAVSLDVHMAS